MKKILILPSCSVAVAALLFAGAGLSFGQTPSTNLNDFDTAINGTPGLAPSGCQSVYGSGAIVWDNSQLYPGTTGSAYVEGLFSTTDGSGHPIIDCICFPPYDNWYWDQSGSVDLANYTAVQFQLLWDTVNSTMSIDQFNNPATYQSALAGSAQGLNVDWTTGNGDNGTFGNFNIPDAASNNWVTITVPIPNTLYPSAGTGGIFLDKYIAGEGNLTGTPPNALFWIANVQLIGNEGPPPPPTLSAPTTPTSGLNVWNASEGNSFYDRNEVGLVASNGVSWVGTASSANPVTYSFTINSFPPSPTGGGNDEAYLMLSPNPASYDNALDYNEANCVVVQVQPAATGSTMYFTFKTNEPGSETYTTVATLNSAQSPVGTWSVTFTSPTNVTLTASDGTQTSFIFTNGADFAEANNPGMYLYLGGQANNGASINHALTYSEFSITGVPAAMSDNFLADATLNTNLWLNFMSHAPGGVFVMPPGAENWITWTLPDAGFQLRDATSLTGAWSIPSGDFILPEVGQVSQLITTNDLPAGTQNAFFQLATP
jgi:hypothetical protein